MSPPDLLTGFFICETTRGTCNDLYEVSDSEDVSNKWGMDLGSTAPRTEIEPDRFTAIVIHPLLVFKIFVTTPNRAGNHLLLY
jgi:hypothetical protein